MPTHSALLTDQYQLVMAQGYWQLGKAEQEAVFQVFFRHHPFGGNFTISCGLAQVIDFIQHWSFTPADIDYLHTVVNAKDHRLFSDDFLAYLTNLHFSGQIDAIPEGTLVFPQQPLLRIQAPILQCQLLETALINFLEFPSLIATKAARICQAAHPTPVIEFGLRRAQGWDAPYCQPISLYWWLRQHIQRTSRQPLCDSDKGHTST